MLRFPLKEQVRLARRHSRFDAELLSKVMEQDRSLVECQATPESRELYNMASNVYTEFNFLRCFLRLETSDKGILHVRHTPEHLIEDMIVSHFSYRFPLFVIVLGSGRGTFIGKGSRAEKLEMDFRSVLEKLEERLEVNGIMREMEAGSFSHETWKEFYKSQQTRPKKGKSVRAAIPKKYMGMESFTEERKALAGKKLSDFF